MRIDLKKCMMAGYTSVVASDPYGAAINSVAVATLAGIGLGLWAAEKMTNNFIRMLRNAQQAEEAAYPNDVQNIRFVWGRLIMKPLEFVKSQFNHYKWVCLSGSILGACYLPALSFYHGCLSLNTQKESPVTPADVLKSLNTEPKLTPNSAVSLANSFNHTAFPSTPPFMWAF